MLKIFKNWILRPAVIVVCSVLSIPLMGVLAVLYVIFILGSLVGSVVAALIGDLYGTNNYIDI